MVAYLVKLLVVAYCNESYHSHATIAPILSLEPCAWSSFRTSRHRVHSPTEGRGQDLGHVVARLDAEECSATLQGVPICSRIAPLMKKPTVLIEKSKQAR